MGATPMITGVTIVIFSLGILFVAMFISSTSGDLKPKPVRLDVMEIENASSTPQKLSIGGKVTEVSPGNIARLLIPSDSLLKIEGNETKHVSFNDPKINKVYITESGVTTNMTTERGSFINSSQRAVQLIETGKDGKIFTKGFVGPGNKIDLLIPVGTLWNVIDPERKHSLGSIKSNTSTRGFVYDGERLSGF
jgi:hypothetical protein